MYLVAWKGPIDSGDDPYTDDCTCHSGLTVRYHVQKIDFPPDKDSNQLKQAIIDHGAVASCITVGQANDMNYTTGGHYTITAKDGNFLFFGLPNADCTVTPSLPGMNLTPANRVMTITPIVQGLANFVGN